jgi:hypothetical protein
MDTIAKVATERNAYFIKLTFYDEFDNLFVPTELHWKLTDRFGNIINERDDIEITVGLATEMYVALGANDLVTFKGSMAARVLTVWGEYTSSTFGAAVPFRRQALFNIEAEEGAD